MYKIFDLHNDYYLKLNTDKKRNIYIDKSSKISKGLITAIWTSELSEMESLSAIERARNFVNQKPGVFLAIEDLHFLNKSNLEKLISFKPLYAGLTWNRSNCLAGGAHESGKITALGKKVISELELNNIVVDSAHLNEESFLDLAKYSNKPYFCSHTAFYGLNQNQRNLKDYQIKMIIDSGGIVGLCLVSEFLNGTNRSTVEDVVSHIDYFACKFGIDNLSVGTDFYGTKFLPIGIKNYPSLVLKVSKQLSDMGYTEKSIDKIFYTNACNFFKL